MVLKTHPGCHWKNQPLAAHVQAATDKKDVKLGHFDKAQPTMTEAIAMPGHPGHRMESKGS